MRAARPSPTSPPPRSVRARDTGAVSVLLLAAAAFQAAFRLHVIYRLAFDARVARRRLGPALDRWNSAVRAKGRRLRPALDRWNSAIRAKGGPALSSAARGSTRAPTAAARALRATTTAAARALRATTTAAARALRATTTASAGGARATAAAAARATATGATRTARASTTSARRLRAAAPPLATGARSTAMAWGHAVDWLGTAVPAAGSRLVTVTGQGTGRVAVGLTKAARGTAGVTARATGGLGTALPAAGAILVTATGRVTGALAAGLQWTATTALAAVAAATGRVSRALPAVGSALVTATGVALHGAAGVFRVLTGRLVPTVAGFVSIALGVVTWGVVVTSAGGPTVGTHAAAVDWELELPDDTELPTLAERSVVYAGDGSVLAVLHDEVDRRIVALDELPDHVWQAVITAEDRRFFEHDGYDVEAIGRAAVANVQARGITQGGSTITQQLAKENFVGDDQTIQRKAAEVTYAIALENRLDKEELLQRYLNQVYFGAGAYGIAAAAEEFFGVAPSELTVEQAATLAGAIRAPSALNPRSDPERATARRDTILAAMVDEGYLDADEAEEAEETPLEVSDDASREIRDPYIVEAVKRDFFDNPAFGETREERVSRLFSGGLEIHTTIDPDLQDIAAEAIEGVFGDGEGPTAAIAAVDPATGRVLAAHSGADFEADQYDLATQGRRQPGSAFKTFVLTAALENGYPLDSALDATSPIDLDFGGRDDWTVSNYGGANLGVIDLEEALVRSSNTAFAQLMLAVGQDPVVDVVGRLGIDVEQALGTESERGPSMALGGLRRGVTPLEMAAAYATFANGGQHAPPYLIERVLDADETEIFSQEPEPQQAVDTAVSAAMTEVMLEVVEDGTGTAAQIDGWDVAGKTGTTQRNADAWFVGYVPVLSTAVWVGHPEGQVRMPDMTGGSVPAQLWQTFMSAALADTEPRSFDFGVTAPADQLVDRSQVEVPDLVGSSRTEALRDLLDAKLVGSVNGLGADDPTSDRTVVNQSPEAGTRVSAGTEVEFDLGESWQLTGQGF